jgi:hypothetical protein
MFNFTVKEFIIGNGTPTLQFYKRGFSINGGGQPSWQDVILSGNTALTLVNSKANGLNYLKLFGGIEQTGTPTPTTPIDIISNNGALKYGKPITLDSTRYYAYISANNSYVYSTDSYSIVVPVTVGQKYKITVDTTTPINGVQNIILRWGFVNNLPPETWKRATGEFPSPSGVTIYNSVRSTPQDTPTVEITATHKYLVIQMGGNIFADNITNGRILLTEQSIYTDGTAETVQVTGKNLFNKDLVPNANEYINKITGNVSPPTSGGFRHSDFIVIKENTQYYVGIITSIATSAGLAFYDNTKTYLSGMSLTELGYNNNIITSPTDTKYIRFSFRIDEGYNTNWQNTVYFVEGNQPLAEFIPYFNGGSATAEMLLKIGNYKDVQSVLDGSVTRNVGIKVLDGSENWSITDDDCFSLQISDKLSGTIIIPISTHFKSATRTGTLHVPDNGIGASANIGNKQVWIKMTSILSVNNFKVYLADQYNAGTPVIVVYPLEVPTTETVTGQPMVIQDGTNTVEITQASIDNLELEVSYKAGVAVTITEVENAQLDNNVEVTING